MAITNISRDWGVDPAIVRITTTNTLAEASTANYITAQATNIEAINSGEWTWQESDMCLVFASDGFMFANISSDFDSLEPLIFTTTVVGTPVVIGDFAIFASTGGNIGDSGFSPSDPAKAKVVMAGSATVVGYLAHFIDTAGTIDDTAGDVTNPGGIFAGLSGTAGVLRSYPASATTGYLGLTGVANSGNFSVQLSNASHGQSTVYSLADIGASTGGIPVATSAIKVKSVAGAAAAGGAAAQSFTDTFCTSGSNVVGNWNTQANAASVLKIVPGNGSFVVTSSADAGVGTFNYVITKL